MLEEVAVEVEVGRLLWVVENSLSPTPRPTHPTPLSLPPTTEYELTPLGRRLEAVLVAMAEFGERLPDDTG